MIHTFTRRTLGAAFAAAIGATLLPAQPVQAGMGTGNPPPPPPPPMDVKARVYEASQDVSLQGRGYSGVTVLHTASTSGRTSTLTGNNGSFVYTILTGQSYNHSASLFGIRSNWTTGDIVISSDARLEIKVARDEEEFTTFGAPLKWRMGVKVFRGVLDEDKQGETMVDLGKADMGARSFGTRFVARHLTADPLKSNSRQPKVKFVITKLEGLDDQGNIRMRWVDSIEKGEKELLPGQSTSVTLSKIVAVTEK